MAERLIHSKEQRTSSPRCKQQHGELFYVSHCPPSSKLKESQHSSVLSPPSTPSPNHPFIYLDSTSTASLSHLLPQSHAASSQNAQKHPPQHTPQGSEESESSSGSPDHTSTRPHEVSVASVFPQRVSIEQHLQHGDVGREEAMQSFILQRFLPAAKAVAEDHGCSAHSTGKHHPSSISSTILQPTLQKSTLKGETMCAKKNLSSPSALNASKSVTWSPRLSSNEEGEVESLNHEVPAKSCGFFCVGLKAAVSRVHNVVNTSAHNLSRSKSVRATLSSSHGTSSDEEDVIPKVNVAAESSRKQRCMSTLAPHPSSSSFSTTDAFPRRPSSLKKSPAQGLANNPKNIHTDLDSRPLLNQCITCHSSSQINQPPAEETTHEHACNGAINRQSAPSRSCRNGHSLQYAHENTVSRQVPASLGSFKESLVQQNDIDSALRKVSRQVPGSLGSFKESLVQQNDIDSALRKVSRQVPGSLGSFKESLVRQKDIDGSLWKRSEEDDVEFFDALSRFDVLGSPRSSATPKKYGSVKSQNYSGSLQSQNLYEHNLIQTHHTCIDKTEVLGSDADHKSPWREHSEMKEKESLGSLAPSAAVKQRIISSSQVGKDGHMAGRPSRHKKSLSSPGLGWPFGICSFQAETTRALAQETKHCDNSFAASAEVQVAKMACAEEQERCNGRSAVELSTPCTKKPSSEELAKHGDKCAANVSFSLDESFLPVPPLTTSADLSSPPVPLAPTSSWLGVAKHGDKCAANVSFSLDESFLPVPPLTPSADLSSPPVPPAPTSSWLGKALALKESKPTYLATLEPQEKVLSVQKKLDFTSIVDVKKEVRWEDVVKGSQMHPEQFGFSEEIRHHHPANQNAMRPLAL